MNRKEPPLPPIQFRDGELARREGGRVSVRQEPLRVRFELPDLLTADGHRLHVLFACCVLPLAERAERQMLEEAFLSDRNSAAVADVSRHFTPRLKADAGRAVERRTVTQCLEPAAREELTELLRGAASAVAFSCGLDLLPPYQIDIESPSLQRLQQDRSARELAERTQTERLSHLRRSAEVLREFDLIRQKSPGLPVSALIGRMSSSDQASVVQGLITAGATASGTVYAVAGPCLVKVSVDSLATEQIPTPTDAGPLRSVQEITTEVGETRLAVGGRNGVVVLDPGTSAAEFYAAPGVESAMGFNRVVAWNGRLWASHSEVGLVAWDLGRCDQPSLRIGRERLGTIAADGPRHLRVAGGRLLFAIGPTVCMLDETLEPQGASDGGSAEMVVALLPHPQGILAVRTSGDIDVLDPISLKVIRRDRRSSRVTAAAILPFYDAARVLLATEDGPLTCLSPDDGVVLQFSSPHRGLRTLAAATGQVAGVSADRQRVVLFDLARTEPAREIHIAATIKHRVGDVAFGRPFTPPAA